MGSFDQDKLWFSLSEILSWEDMITTQAVLTQTNKAWKLVCAKQKFGSKSIPLDEVFAKYQN